MHAGAVTSPLSERVLDVLERGELAVGVDRDADRVEAQLRHTWALGVLLQPGGCHAAKAAALAGMQAVERRRAALTARLDLAEDDAPSVAGDQVDLAPAGAVVAGEDRETATLEVLGGELLACASEAVAEVV